MTKASSLTLSIFPRCRSFSLRCVTPNRFAACAWVKPLRDITNFGHELQPQQKIFCFCVGEIAIAANTERLEIIQFSWFPDEDFGRRELLGI